MGSPENVPQRFIDHFLQENNGVLAMRISIIGTLLLAMLTQGVHAENATDNFTNASNELCLGTWTLINPAGWCVQDESGTILPLSASTIILGCDKTPTSLSENLVGASVDINCTEPYVKGGLPEITSILIICK